MDIRRSPASSRNPLVSLEAATRGAAAPGVPGGSGGNAAWFAKHAEPGTVVFVGGAGLTDFRVRVAQSHLRNDMLPSFWSIVGVASAGGMLTVPLAAAGDPSLIPATNAVRVVKFSEFDDVAQYPNVGAIRFADQPQGIVTNAERLIQQRNAIDLPSMLLVWLGFVWGAGTKRNPLLENVGLPAAAFVETAFGMAGIELTPGLSSGSSCPEAIWQSALWWHDYYKESASLPEAKLARAKSAEPREPLPRAAVPAGAYRVLQPAAAVTYELVATPRGARAQPASASPLPTRPRPSKKRS